MAAKASICSINSVKDFFRTGDHCKYHCINRNFCRKRAELLESEVNVDE